MNRVRQCKVGQSDARRLTLNEVEKLEVQEDGFSLILVGGQSLTLKTPEASLEPWLSSLKPLLKASDGSDKAKSNLMACGTPVFFVPSLVTTGDYPTMCIPGSPTAVTAPQAPDKPSVMKEPPVTQQVAAQAMQQMNSAAQAHVAQAIRLQAQAKAVAQYIHNHSGGPSNGYSNFNDLTPTGPMSPISSEARTMPEIPAPATEPASKAVGSQREIGSVSVGAVPRGLSGHAALPEDAEDEPFLPSEPAQIKLGTLRSLSSNSLPVQVDDDDDMADRGMPGMSSSMAQALKVKNTFYDFETDCTPLGNRLRPICSAAGRLDALAAEEEELAKIDMLEQKRETALGGSLAPGSLAPGSLAPGPTLSSNAAPGGSDLAHANGLTAPEIMRVLCSGYLNVERKGQVKTPFFVLRENSLERYDTATDFEKGQDPRTMPLADIEKVTVKELRLTLEVRDQKKPVEFQVDSTKEFVQWGRALEKLLAQRLGDAYRQIEKGLLVAVCCRLLYCKSCLEGFMSHDNIWFRHHTKENFVSSAEGLSGRGVPSDGGHASASVSGGTTPREGELLILKRNREDPRYCVLRTDCFEYFSSKDDYQTGVAARARALIEDITAFEVLDDGTMEVELGDKKLAFKALTPEDLYRWQTAWETDPEEPLKPSQATMPKTGT
eukprot:s3795_g2.t2